MSDPTQTDLAKATARIVAAYVCSHAVELNELPDFIRGVHKAVVRTTAGRRAPTRWMTIARSITPQAIISFEDGRPYRSLTKHLSARGLTPDAYRAKWSLPADYPMVSATYSGERSRIAKAQGLGVRGRPPAAALDRARGATAPEPRPTGHA